MRVIPESLECPSLLSSPNRIPNPFDGNSPLTWYPLHVEDLNCEAAICVRGTACIEVGKMHGHQQC